MFTFRKTLIADGRSYKYQLFDDKNKLTYATFLKLLKNENRFCLFFIDLLAEVPFRAYHWETPPITTDTSNQLFEFVITRSPGIDLPSDPGPFRQYFDSNKDTAVFDNLGGDAKLIAPTPASEPLNYSHIGVFTKEAPKDQQLAFWQAVAKETSNRISDKPIWLNTAGGGVAWLHVRLDTKPKYYLHQPYTSPS